MTTASTAASGGTARQDDRKPEAVFRIGSVSAAVFGHDIAANGEQRTVRNVTVRKRFPAENGDSRYTSSLGLAELPQALRALQLALEYVEAREAQVVRGD
jgi:hypothetical protein